MEKVNYFICYQQFSNLFKENYISMTTSPILLEKWFEQLFVKENWNLYLKLKKL